MPRCPKCQYILVLLEYRQKYKCAKCSKLFSQIKIDNKGFREWNEKQRELDRELMFKKRMKHKKQNKIDIRERRALRGLRLLFRNRRIKLSKEERKLRKIESDLLYGENHREQRVLNSKIWFENNKERKYQYFKDYRKNNIERARLLTRIHFWRQKQKKLALEMLENKFI